MTDDELDLELQAEHYARRLAQWREIPLTDAREIIAEWILEMEQVEREHGSPSDPPC